jgi:hypothetical protein
MTRITRYDVARQWGYRLRSTMYGDWLEQPSGEGLMLIDSANLVTLYAHDAQAYMVARMIAAMPR